MTRQRKILVAACVVLAFLVLVVAAFVLWANVWFPYSFDQPMKYVATHSSGNEAVFLFLQHGALTAQRLSLFVRPKGQAELIWVGTVQEDDMLQFIDAYWSHDGTIIACRSAVIGYNTANFAPSDKARLDVPDGVPFTHAYDFSGRQSLLVPRDDTGDDGSGWVARSRRIEALLDEHGGKIECLTRDAFSGKCAKVSYREWKALKSLEAAAMRRLTNSGTQP